MKFSVVGALLTVGVVAGSITFGLMRNNVAGHAEAAQDVVLAAAITEVSDPNDELLAALADGADPSTLSAPTAAGGPVNGAGLPFAGLGGDGNGGGAPSASLN